jgi:hypothetical protein
MHFRLYGERLTIEAPWRFLSLPELGVAVVALNSTMAESHTEHYGWLGEDQLRAFAGELPAAGDVVRLAVLHHNPVRGAGHDDAHLRDADRFVELLAPTWTWSCMDTPMTRASSTSARPRCRCSAPAAPGLAWRSGRAPDQGGRRPRLGRRRRGRPSGALSGQSRRAGVSAAEHRSGKPGGTRPDTAHVVGPHR